MAALAKELTHHYAVSADGTQLSYYSCGRGKTVLIIHGALSYALIHKDLALALSPYYRVCIASRRERGRSGPYPNTVTELGTRQAALKTTPLQIGNVEFHPPYSRDYASAVLTTDIADIEALVAETEAEYIIGNSAGALVTAHALMPSSLSAHPELSRVKGAILYEPPLVFSDRDAAVDLPLLSRWEAEWAAGDKSGAIVTAFRFMQFGPTWAPYWFMKPVAGLMMRWGQRSAEKRRDEGNEEGACTMLDLGGTLRYDIAGLVGATIESTEYRELGERPDVDRVRVLLLSGSQSPQYLCDSVRVLGEMIPDAKSVVFPGVGHMLLCGNDFGGRPATAVNAMRDFIES